MLEDKTNILIVCHGMILRCFLARFLHLTIEQFEDMHNSDNYEVATIRFKEDIVKPVFDNGRLGRGRRAIAQQRLDLAIYKQPKTVIP